MRKPLIATDRQTQYLEDLIDVEKLAPLFQSYRDMKGTTTVLMSLNGTEIIDTQKQAGRSTKEEDNINVTIVQYYRQAIKWTEHMFNAY